MKWIYMVHIPLPLQVYGEHVKISELKGIFNLLEKYGAPLYEEQMMEHILDQIISPNTELNTEVNICRFLYSSVFMKAPKYLSMVFTRLYPTTNPSSGCFRKSVIYATVRGDRGRGRGGLFNG